MMTENPGYLSTEQRQFTGFELFAAVIPWLMKNKGYKVPYPEMYSQLIAYDEAELDFPIWRLEFVPTYLIEAQKRLGRGPVGGLVRVFKLEHMEPFTEEKWATVTANPGLVGAYSENAKDFGHHEYFNFPDSLRPIGESKYREADPNASDKPTWAELNYAYASWVIDRQARKQDAFNRAVIDAREKSDALRNVTLGGEDLHAGTGIDHMTGLVHMAARSTNAGIAPPLVVMRDHKGGSRNVWLASERDELLDDAMKRRNVEESARNVVSTELAQLYAVRDSRTETAAKKIEAFNKANDLLAGFDAKVEAAKTDLAAESYLDLPLDELRPKLVELLESRAMGKTREVMKASTQQGIDRGFACVDEETAVREVAKQAVLAILEVEAAGTTDDAKSAFQAGAAAIDLVTPLNTPTWDLNGVSVSGANPPMQTHQGAAIVVGAHQPSGQNVPGRAAIRVIPLVVDPATGLPVKHTAQLSTPSGHPTSHQVEISLDQTVTVPVLLTVKADNICGRSTILVKMVPPSA